jgi:hypothetical protein
VRVREGDVTKRVNARDENEINNTGFGVNRYRCVHTPVLEVRQCVYTIVLNLVAVPLY